MPSTTKSKASVFIHDITEYVHGLKVVLVGKNSRLLHDLTSPHNRGRRLLARGPSHHMFRLYNNCLARSRYSEMHPCCVNYHLPFTMLSKCSAYSYLAYSSSKEVHGYGLLVNEMICGKFITIRKGRDFSRAEVGFKIICAGEDDAGTPRWLLSSRVVYGSRS
ncbi:hypothetical protein J6590_054643 [Homalodisca vitripennis]|nr:hypothetical protein J6590_054643 [Homalodisca vitripennis]